MFSPELSQHWPSESNASSRVEEHARADDTARAQQEALEELAERVNAARLVY